MDPEAPGRGVAATLLLHYAMHVVPHAMIATVAALAVRPRASRGPLVVAMLVATAVTSVHFGAFVGNRFRTSFHEVSFDWKQEDARRQRAFEKVAARIPSDATLAAGEHEAPHLARRPRLLSLKEGVGDARFVVYSVRSLRWGGRDDVVKALMSGTHGVIIVESDVALLERGASTARNQTALRQLDAK